VTGRADLDQKAADASLASGVSDPETHALTTGWREAATRARGKASTGRDDVGGIRDLISGDRDRAAKDRDAAAVDRDAQSDPGSG
jgi:hypothetical protein